jgi:AmmeMemoRadiSam system protein B
MEMKRVRLQAHAGTFYPNSADEIRGLIEHFNKILDGAIKLNDIVCNAPAFIVPHAGYIYSGFSANVAYRVLKTQDIDSVVVIGPSHRVYLDGISISDFDEYETPFGNLSIDSDIVADISKLFDISCVPKAHQEHSTEVQMPLLKYYNPDIKVVEMVYGNVSAEVLSKIIDYLLDKPKVAIFISTDLSHFYDINRAKILDGICLEAIDKLDINLLNQGCEACGKIGVEAMIKSAKRANLMPKILDYRTSADSSGNKDEVVGYTSVAFCREF